MSVVLCVAAHPDDEILGVGGTLARHAAMGDAVYLMIVGEGITSRHEPTAVDQLDALRIAATAAAAAIGARPPIMTNLPDNRLDSLDLLTIIQSVERVVSELKPHTVYTHHGADVNMDHRVVHQAVVTATRPLPGSSVRRLYAFETISSTEWATPSFGPAFRPNTYVDVTPYMGAKMEALRCYESEMRAFPHARSMEAVEALARLRGTQVSCAAAEAFELLREVEY